MINWNIISLGIIGSIQIVNESKIFETIIKRINYLLLRKKIESAKNVEQKANKSNIQNGPNNAKDRIDYSLDNLQ